MKRCGKSSRFFLAPFDTAAAVEAWELIAKMKKEQPGQNWATWAKVKFDCQIAATAKSLDIKRIYSDDKDIKTHGDRLGIVVLRICDLEVPAELRPKESIPEQPGLDLGPPVEEEPQGIHLVAVPNPEEESNTPEGVRTPTTQGSTDSSEPLERC